LTLFANELTVVIEASSLFKNICSIAFTCAPSCILFNLSFNSSEKSLEVRVFPSILSTLVSKVSAKPAILDC